MAAAAMSQDNNDNTKLFPALLDLNFVGSG
jgi:hypothetical protein